MCHQELHLVGQNAPVAQNEVFPQARYVGRVQKRHVGLLGGAATLAVVAGAAGRDNVHPVVNAVLGKGNDVLAGQVLFMEMVAAIGADVAVTGKKLAICQAWLEIEGVDVGNTPRANDAVDRDDGLLTRNCIVATMEHRDFTTGFPAHLARGVMNHRLLKRNPRLGQPLG